MSTFWVVFNRREQVGKQPALAPVGSIANVAPAKTIFSEGDGAFSGQLEDACVVKIEGAGLTTELQAAEAVRSAYQGLMTGRPNVIANANFKEKGP